MSRLRTIHLICNAHIDPVWLWPWSAGLDEILNTCESVCNLLDRHPDVVFTRGESWVYEQIEQIDPALLRRIKRHVKAGRWEPVGGWFIQPDCNLPGAYGFRKQIELGREYFERTFGSFPRVAYNVDSFGHSAALPGLMAEAGQTHYIMMRPQEHEVKLPARLFRWRGYADGPEIVTFRIAGAYCTPEGLTREHLEKSLADLPAGVSHTMCFIGVGDHGGGPTEEMVQWCRAQRDALPGVRLEFSSPTRFFKAIAAEGAELPLVTGELQMHAVGCYSVHRAIKTGTQHAEHLLEQAEHALAGGGGGSPRLVAKARAELKEAVRWLCFNQFHDTLGGTCIPSAYPQAEAQLGYARTVADQILCQTLRRVAVKLPPVLRQRLVLASYGAPFEGWIEHEPWLEWTRWQPDWVLLDENGREVPHQTMQAEAAFFDTPRLLFKLALEPGVPRVLQIARRPGSAPRAATAAATVESGPTFARMEPRRRKGGKGEKGGPEFSECFKGGEAPVLELIEDKSDTWSHGVESYTGATTVSARWGRPRLVDDGPLMRSWRVDGRIGGSPLEAEWRRYEGEAFWELRLRVEWREFQRILRLSWAPGGVVGWREDGITGGGLRRESDGREYSLRDRSWLQMGRGKAAGVVAPTVYSVSGTRRALRLTLLRSAVMAHHDPHDGRSERRVISDRGGHAWVMRFFPAQAGLTPGALDRHALALHRPPGVVDLTKGMPLRPLRGQVERGSALE